MERSAGSGETPAGILIRIVLVGSALTAGVLGHYGVAVGILIAYLFYILAVVRAMAGPGERRDREGYDRTP
jgi:hypothetical protein